jgi:hypothetical protein
MVRKMVTNIAPLHTFQIKKKLSKYMQPILKYSKNNMQFFDRLQKPRNGLPGLCDQLVAHSFRPNR